MTRAEAIEKAARELSEWWNGRQVGDVALLINAVDKALAMKDAPTAPVITSQQYNDEAYRQGKP